MTVCATPPVPKKTEATPDRKAWATFWETVNQLQPEAWQQKYSTEDLKVKTNGTHDGVIVFDGMLWSLCLKVVGQKQAFSSAGDNAYPTIGNSKQTTLDAAAVNQLVAAFDQLIAATAAK